MGHVGAMLRPSRAKLSQVGAKLTQVDPKSIQVDPNLASSWLQDGTEVAPSWSNVARRKADMSKTYKNPLTNNDF